MRICLTAVHACMQSFFTCRHGQRRGVARTSVSLCGCVALFCRICVPAFAQLPGEAYSVARAHNYVFLNASVRTNVELFGVFRSSSVSLYVYKDNKAYWGRGAEHGHLDFHIPSEL